MAPSKVLVALNSLLWYQCQAIRATEINRFRGNHSQVRHQSKEVIMEIAVIPGLFVGIFALGAAMILWFPYDK
jgi:hypothetical protein